MPLTTQDLKQIKSVITEVVCEVSVTKQEFSDFRSEIRSDMDRMKSEIKADMDRMESRMITAMGLLERGSDSRLADHEVRIRRLETRLVP